MNPLNQESDGSVGHYRDFSVGSNTISINDNKNFDFQDKAVPQRQVSSEDQAQMAVSEEI